MEKRLETLEKAIREATAEMIRAGDPPAKKAELEAISKIADHSRGQGARR